MSQKKAKYVNWFDSAYVPPPPPPSPPPPITDVIAGYNWVQYADTPIEVTGLSSPMVSVETWSWKFKNSTTGTVVNFSPAQNPIISLPVGIYDIELLAYNSVDTFRKYYRHAIKVFPHRLVEAECDIVIDCSAGNYFHDFSAAATPDLKVGIKGSGTMFMQPYAIHGTSGHPVIFQVLGNSDVNIVCPVGQPHTLRFDGNVQYVQINGTKDDGTNGLKISAGDSTNIQTVMLRDGLFTDVEYWGIDVTASILVFGAAFSFIPTVSAGSNATNWQINNLVVCRCNTNRAGDEGCYMGYNNDSPQSGFIPPTFKNCIIAWNNFVNSGRDGVQPGSCVGVEVHDNFMDGFGLHGVGSQESACSWNGGTYGFFYNNVSRNGKMWLNVQSGQTPWDIFGGATTPTNSYFFSNVHIAGTQTGLGSAEPFVVYVQTTNGTGAGAGHLNYNFSNNTVITVAGQKFMEQFWSPSSFTATDVNVIDNVIVYGAATGGTTTEVNFAGTGTKPTAGQYTINNCIRLLGTESTLLFTNLAAYDVTIASFLSPVYAGSPSDVAAKLPALAGYYNDNLGIPLLAGANPYTFGAYSGYQKRGDITTTPVDPNPATFSTPVSVGSLTSSGGTIAYNANKLGSLEFIISTHDVAPTKAQILAGQEASGAVVTNGNIYDPGTPTSLVISSLSPGTAYYLFCCFWTNDSIPQVAVTRVAFTTTSDTTPPTISNFNITNANRTRVNFDSDKIITGSTFAHFTLATPTKTITALHIETGALTGHYFTVSVAYSLADVAPTLAYAGGDNIQDTATVPNLLQAFGATAITNGITPAAAEDVVYVNGVVTPTINGNDITATATNDNARSSQIIPAASNGYVTYTYNDLSRSNFQGARYGLILSASARTFANIIIGLDVRANNVNVDVWEGTTFKATVSNNQGAGRIYRFRIPRTTNKPVYESSTNGGASWTPHYTYSGTSTGDMRAGVVLGTSGRGVFDAQIQADTGLI